MMIKRLCAAAVAILMSGLATPAAAAVLVDPLNGISLSTFSTVSVKKMVVNDQDDLTVFAAPAAPATVTSAAAALSGKYSASAHNVVTATFATAAAGIVTNVGDAVATSLAKGFDANAANGFDFAYAFSTDQDTSFTFAYSFSGPFLPCCGDLITLRDRTTGDELVATAAFNVFLTGGDTLTLLAGHTYDFSVAKREVANYDAPSVFDPGTQTFTHTDRISFSIGGAALPAVPEPASWLMMLSGIGLVGGALRRRRGGVPARI